MFCEKNEIETFFQKRTEKRKYDKGYPCFEEDKVLKNGIINKKEKTCRKNI